MKYYLRVDGIEREITKDQYDGYNEYGIPTGNKKQGKLKRGEIPLNTIIKRYKKSDLIKNISLLKTGIIFL